MIQELTLGEIEEIELLLNMSIDEAEGSKTPKGRYLRALAYVINKRKNPGYKFEDTATLTPTQVKELLDNPKDA